jgi:hypothetical protein
MRVFVWLLAGWAVLGLPWNTFEAVKLVGVDFEGWRSFMGHLTVTGRFHGALDSQWSLPWRTWQSLVASSTHLTVFSHSNGTLDCSFPLKTADQLPFCCQILTKATTFPSFVYCRVTIFAKHCTPTRPSSHRFRRTFALRNSKTSSISFKLLLPHTIDNQIHSNASLFSSEFALSQTQISFFFTTTINFVQISSTFHMFSNSRTFVCHRFPQKPRDFTRNHNFTTCRLNFAVKKRLIAFASAIRAKPFDISS